VLALWHLAFLSAALAHLQHLPAPWMHTLAGQRHYLHSHFFDFFVTFFLDFVERVTLRTALARVAVVALKIHTNHTSIAASVRIAPLSFLPLPITKRALQSNFGPPQRF
jgi:hypothetical protein